VKLLISLLVICSALAAEDIKSLPNQAGNGNIDLSGTVTVDPKEIQQIVGAPMDAGYIVVRIKVSPRTIEAIRISPDDFTLISRKDGERSPSLDPNRIFGSPGLVLKQGKARPSGGFGGISVGGIGGGTSPGADTSSVEATPGDAKKAPENPLQKILESKLLPEKETKDPVEGLLYFQLEGKNKPKDLGLLYKGSAGRLAMDFK
jgi:hypothetical protein